MFEEIVTMEEVMVWDRPSMRGEFYEPIEFDMTLALIDLDRTYPARSKWRGARLRRPLMEVARIAEEIERDNL